MLKKILCSSIASLFVLLCFAGCAPRKQTKMGYITQIDIQSGSFEFDEIEWITEDDTQRMQELHLDPSTDMPNGFYIYNPSDKKTNCIISDDTTFEYFVPSASSPVAAATLEEFAARQQGYIDRFNAAQPDAEQAPACGPLYEIEIANNVVVRIVEKYIP
nr:hypothetical protein [bacterium]